MSDTQQEGKKFEITQPVAIIIAGLVIAAAIIFANSRPPEAGVQAAGVQLPANVSIKAPSADDHIVGSLTAPIVLVEYSDFQCPYCTMVHATMKNIVKNSNGQVAWIMRNLPLTQIHPLAMGAANAAECVAEQKGSDGYFAFADAAFANQSNLGPALYNQIATSLGLDMTQFNTCVSTQKYQATIDAQMQDAMNNGANGTPFTVVYGNGQQVPISGALPEAQFNSVISQVLNRQ